MKEIRVLMKKIISTRKSITLIMISIIISIMTLLIGCPNLSPSDDDDDNTINKIAFILDSNSYNYTKGTTYPNFPYEYYIEGDATVDEQYNITGAKTASDFQANKNKIIMSIYNLDNSGDWRVHITWFDNTGSQLDFDYFNYDLSALKNKDTVGGQMTTSINDATMDSSQTHTISNIEIAVIRAF